MIDQTENCIINKYKRSPPVGVAVGRGTQMMLIGAAWREPAAQLVTMLVANRV